MSVTRPRISGGAIFAAQVFLIISDVLGDDMTRKPCEGMAKLYNELGNILKRPPGFDQPFSDPLWWGLTAEAKDLVKRLTMFSHAFRLDRVNSHPDVTRASGLKRMEPHLEPIITRSPEINIVRRWNSVPCGTIIMRIYLLVEQVGVAAARRYGDLSSALDCMRRCGRIKSFHRNGQTWIKLSMSKAPACSVNRYHPAKRSLGRAICQNLGDPSRLPRNRGTHCSLLDTADVSKLLLMQVENEESVVGNTYAVQALCSKKRVTKQSFPPIELLSGMRKALPDLLRTMCVAYDKELRTFGEQNGWIGEGPFVEL